MLRQKRLKPKYLTFNIEHLTFNIKYKVNRNEIESKVRDFLIEDLEVDEEKIFPDARLKEDVGIDSLDFVDIVVIVEKNFGFKIKPEEMTGVKTLNDFYSYIEKKVNV